MVVMNSLAKDDESDMKYVDTACDMLMRGIGLYISLGHPLLCLPLVKHTRITECPFKLMAVMNLLARDDEIDMKYVDTAGDMLMRGIGLIATPCICRIEYSIIFCTQTLYT